MQVHCTGRGADERRILGDGLRFAGGDPGPESCDGLIGIGPVVIYNIRGTGCPGVEIIVVRTKRIGVDRGGGKPEGTGESRSVCSRCIDDYVVF